MCTLHKFDFCTDFVNEVPKVFEIVIKSSNLKHVHHSKGKIHQKKTHRSLLSLKLFLSLQTVLFNLSLCLLFSLLQTSILPYLIRKKMNHTMFIVYMIYSSDKHSAKENSVLHTGNESWTL